MHVCVLSCVCLFPNPQTVACQAPLPMGFSRQGHRSGLPFPPLGDLSDQGIKHMSLVSPPLAVGSLPLHNLGQPINVFFFKNFNFTGIQLIYNVVVVSGI